MQVVKRDGSLQEFDRNKVKEAISKAFDACECTINQYDLDYMVRDIKIWDKITIEEIQDIVIETLRDYDFDNVADAYKAYKDKQSRTRLLLDKIAYMESYINSSENAATMSNTDGNANTSAKNVATLEPEVFKDNFRDIQRYRMKKILKKLYPEVASQYERDLNHHIIYTHDEASTPTLKQYCMAVSLYPLMLNGCGILDKTTPSAPNDIQSFSGQLVNSIFTLSSQCKGAVAVGSYFIALNYYIIAEYGPYWYTKLDVVVTNEHCLKKRTLKNVIQKAFKTFVLGINQPAGNRGYQSPFVNVSYYDHTYFDSLFGDFYYPDGTKPEWEAVDALQRLFMNWFNEWRLTQLAAFPVETFAMVHDGHDIIDKEYKNLCAEMYAKGHSFFTYISDSADSLASCCFTPETKVLWKSSTKGVQLTTLKELDDLKWEPDKKNLKIFHNGFWIGGKTIKTSNTDFYRVETANHKVYYMTNNHINVTFDGEKKTENLKVGDYLMFNTHSLQAVPEKDEHLTYEQGFAVGAFLGDGSFGTRFKDGTIYEINYSQNVNKYENCMYNVSEAAHQLGSENSCILNTPYNNVYPIRISCKELVAFIQRWTNWTEGTYAHNKELNLDCLLQSYEFRKGILDGWYNTDGGNSNRCYTSSEKLKDCMEALITSLGINTIIDKSDRTDEKVIIRGKEYNRNYPLWCVRWYDSCNKTNMANIYKWKNNSQFFMITSIEHLGESPEEKYSYCIECSDKSNPYFTLPSGLITHNCRLRNELAENTFNPTSGLTGIKTGSCNVITLNINRIVQDWYNLDGPQVGVDYDIQGIMHDSKDRLNTMWIGGKSMAYATLKGYLIQILKRIYKYHIAYKTMLYDWEDKGAYASSNGDFIHISDLYSTIGLNGLNNLGLIA